MVRQFVCNERRANTSYFHMCIFDASISACLSLIRALKRDISIQFAQVNRAHAIESIDAELIGRDTFHSRKDLMTIDIHSNR